MELKTGDRVYNTELGETMEVELIKTTEGIKPKTEIGTGAEVWRKLAYLHNGNQTYNWEPRVEVTADKVRSV